MNKLAFSMALGIAGLACTLMTPAPAEGQWRTYSYPAYYTYTYPAYSYYSPAYGYGYYPPVYRYDYYPPGYASGEIPAWDYSTTPGISYNFDPSVTTYAPPGSPYYYGSNFTSNGYNR